MASPARSSFSSIQFELFHPPFPVFPIRLIGLLQQEIFNDEIVHFGAHKAFVGIFRCAYDGFASHVKTGIHNNAVTGFFLEGIDQLPVSRIGFSVNGLYTCRKIQMCYCLYIASFEIEPVPQVQFVVVAGYRLSSFFINIDDKQNIWRGDR